MNFSRSLLAVSCSFLAAAPWLGCSASSSETPSDGTDDVAADASAKPSPSKKKKPLSETSEDPPPVLDSGVAADDAGSLVASPMSLVAPRLHEATPGVFTIVFRLRNASASVDFRAFTRIKVKADLWSFPTIDSVLCPETTPGYQWAVPANGVSEEVGIAFMSNPAATKTAIDMTCGSKETLQSVPYGFSAAPPFYLHIEGVMADGSVATVTHTFSKVE